MFTDAITSNIFVRILIFAFITIIAVNIIAALVNLGLTIYMKANRIK